MSSLIVICVIYLISPVLGKSPPICEDSIALSTFKIIPDPSPLETQLSSAIVRLLKNFAKVSSGMGLARTTRELDGYLRALKRELFTLQTGNHFVLPADKKEVEQSLRSKVKTFAAKWYDLGQAVNADQELDQEIRSSLKYFISEGKNLKVENLYERVLKNYAISNKTQHPWMTANVSAAQQPKVYFPLVDLVTGRKNISSKRITEWMNNFEVRKFLIHERFLLGTKNDMALRAIVEIAPEWRDLGCMYTQILNSFAQNFAAENYPSMMMVLIRKSMLQFVDVIPELADAYQRQLEMIQSNVQPTVTRFDNVNRKQFIEEHTQNSFHALIHFSSSNFERTRA